MYHGSDETTVVPSERPLYVTPSADYGYIQKKPHVYRALFQPKAPYWIDNQNTIESMRQRPEVLVGLKQLGYDSVIYASPKNIYKGASGWGSDVAQYIVLDPNSVHAWELMQQKPRATEIPNDVYPDHLHGPVYHSSQLFFVNYDVLPGNEGIHFGSRIAAEDRQKALGLPLVEIKNVEPSVIDRLRYQYKDVSIENDKRTSTLVDNVIHVLLRKLENPKSNIPGTVQEMSSDEQIKILSEYTQKPDASTYQQSLMRAEAGVHYEVTVSGHTLWRGCEIDVAHWMKKSIEAHQLKSAYLVMKNPVELPDLGLWSARDIAHHLNLTDNEKEQFSQSEQPYTWLSEFFHKNGIDGIRYRNKVEGTERKWSYIATQDTQIIPIGPKLSAYPTHELDYDIGYDGALESNNVTKKPKR